MNLKDRITISEALKTKEGSKVSVAGWLENLNVLGKIAFLKLRDGTSIMQLVVSNKKLLEELKLIHPETVVLVEGLIQKGQQKSGDRELVAEKFEYLGFAEAPLPIDFSGKIATSMDKKLDWRCLSLRNKKDHSIFKVQAKLIEGIQEWLNKNGFYQVFTPCIMGTPSESGSEVFEIKYYNKKAFLRQDPQLHRQLTIAGGLTKIYDIGPSWRAEKSHTSRHLCEHRTCAVEIGFIKSEQDTMRIEEQVIISAFRKVNESCQAELKELQIKLKIPKAPFLELKFPEVYSILEKMNKKKQIGDTLDTEDDKLLWEYIQKEYPACEFYFINGFPFAHKPFYVMNNENSKYARSVDLYYKGIEMSSGGQREHRYNKLIDAIKEKKLNPKSVEWFTKFFKYGVPPHGGFALGIERITMALLDLDNIRKAVLFPRDSERFSP